MILESGAQLAGTVELGGGEDLQKAFFPNSIIQNLPADAQVAQLNMFFNLPEAIYSLAQQNRQKEPGNQSPAELPPDLCLHPDLTSRSEQGQTASTHREESFRCAIMVGLASSLRATTPSRVMAYVWRALYFAEVDH